MLTDAELTELRAVAEEAMPDTCTIRTPTETNTKGSVATTYASTYTNVPCRLMPVRERDREYVTGEKVTKVASYVLTVPWDQAIEAGYQVVHGGVTYEVLGVHPRHSYRTANRADVVEVR
jgi:hypothetical protein